MTGRRAPAATWWAPVAAGLLLAGLFLVLVGTSPTLRHYWPLLIGSAVAPAVPFLLRSPRTRATRPSPVRVASPGPGRRSGAADLSGAAGTPGAAAVALVVSAVTLAKAGAGDAANEDAYGIDAAGGCLAVADGASASYRAAEWARILCSAFVQQRPLDAVPSPRWIARAADTFRAGAATAPTDGTAAGTLDDADWWSAEATQRGAHAAFAGLAVVPERHGVSWRGTAVGDCVLVHLRAAPDGRLPIVTAFPIPHSASFPAEPALLSSAAPSPPPVHYIHGSAAVGDVWLLMTDELARWALRRHEAGDPLWTFLARAGEAEIRAAVAAARAGGLIADDDMTVVRCEAVAAVEGTA